MKATECVQWILIGVLAGCGPQAAATADETSEPGTSTSGVPGTSTGDGPTTTAAATGVVGTGGLTDSSGVDGTSMAMESNSAVTFIPAGEDLNGHVECDTFAQDCPQGGKCAAYAVNGASSWNATKCMPVMDDPKQIGEPCFVEDNAVSGIDDCVPGAICWDADAQNQGTCVEMCGGTEDSPVCAAGLHCEIVVDEVLFVCGPNCDPLMMDCAAGEVCVPADDGFGCAVDGSGRGGQLHDVCEYVNACDPGLVCGNTSSAVECDQNAGGCCEPWCDVAAPNTCPGQGQVCLAAYDEDIPPPAGYENLGFCSVPL